MNRDNKFLKVQYLKNLFPIIFSVLGGTINALIDSVFVSLFLGEEGLAAVNVCMPIYLVICTFGSLIAAGASVMSSQATGKDDMKRAVWCYRVAFMMNIILGAVFTAAGILLCDPISGLLSQNGSLKDYVYIYSFITMIGILPTMLSYLPMYYLQMEGKMKHITVSMIMMITLDTMLDWVLMYIFDMGIYGAAFASLFSCLITCIYSYIAMETGYSNYHLKPVSLKLSDIKEIIRYGSPSALGNFTDAAKLLLLNALFLKLGGASVVAVWAVINSLSELAVSITSGVPQAAAPMVAAYYTARENSGLRILMKLQIKYGLTIAAIFGIILTAMHLPLEMVFSVSERLFLPLVCLSVYILFDLISSVFISFFQTTDRVLLSNILVVFRRFLFPVGTAALVLFFGRYTWLFLPIGSILTILAGMICTAIVWRSESKVKRYLSKLLLLDDYLEREKKVIDFSIVPENEIICNASEQIIDFCSENKMNSRQTMKLQLAIEELLTIIARKNTGVESIDLRAFALDDVIGLRIRCAGHRYNPFENQADIDDDEMLGIAILIRLSKNVSFTYSLGINVINIAFENNTNVNK